MSSGQLLYLSQADVERVGLSMREVIEAVETAFREKDAGRTEMPPKPGIHPGPGDSFIHAMPAFVPALGAAGIKWVSGYPENHKRSLPYVTGLLILNEVETGLPIAVMDCVWITAVRTAAASAVAAKYLARPDASVVGVLGCGVQGRTNVDALAALFPLRRVMAYDIDRHAAQRYAEEIRARFHLSMTVVDAPREAVSGCDMIVTAGPILREPHRTIQAGWMDEGAFASLVDFDSYWHPAAMHQADKFCTDDVAQLRFYQQLGYFQDIPSIYAELGELASGQKAGRERRAERTLAANTGLAIHDMAVASRVYERAVEKEIGVWLPL